MSYHAALRSEPSRMVHSAAADDVFRALSNPTRRKVLERLSVGPASVSELAAPFDTQLPSFVQHLSVLEQSRLVWSKKRGRVRIGCFLEVLPMERLVWTSMLFPGYRPAVFDDIPITAIVTMENVGTGTRYVFTALHRDEADLGRTRRVASTRAPRSPSISSSRM